MDTRTLDSVPGFVITDVPDAPIAVGPLRTGVKLIPGNAVNYAREVTYGFGLLGEQACGMTAGLKVDADGREAAVEQLVTELGDDLGRRRFDSGLRAPQSSLAPLTAHDPRPASRLEPHGAGVVADHLEALGVVASATALLGDVGGRRIALEGLGPVTLGAARLLTDAGAVIARVGHGGTTVSADSLAVDDLVAGAADADALAGLGSTAAAWAIWKGDVDLVVAGSASGVMKDQGAVALGDTPVIGYGTAPIATKALATSIKAGGAVMPAFATSLGRRVADLAASDSTADALIDATNAALERVMSAVATHERGVFVGACLTAEAYIGSWATPPFGRPLA